MNRNIHHLLLYAVIQYILLLNLDMLARANHQPISSNYVIFLLLLHCSPWRTDRRTGNTTIFPGSKKDQFKWPIYQHKISDQLCACSSHPTTNHCIWPYLVLVLSINQSVITFSVHKIYLDTLDNNRVDLATLIFLHWWSWNCNDLTWCYSIPCYICSMSPVVIMLWL